MPARQHSSTSTGSVRNVALLSAWIATKPKREGAPKVCIDVCHRCNFTVQLTQDGLRVKGETHSEEDDWNKPLKSELSSAPAC